MMSRTYSELIRNHAFIDRFRYLQLRGGVGDATFGFDRYLNQRFYRSHEWLRIRNKVIVRDQGFDLGAEDRPIPGRILVHHMNPLTPQELESDPSQFLDPEFLICVSHNTHNAIHYSDESLLIGDPVDRKPGDTALWTRERIDHG